MLYLKWLLRLSLVMRGMKSDEQLKCFLCAHKTISLETMLCVFNVKRRIVRGRKVIFLTACAKFLPLLADLWKSKDVLPYFFTLEWNSSIL